MPREWIKHQIQKVAEKQSQNHYRTMFEFLTGRPMSSDENHCAQQALGDRRWFLDQLNEEEHTLSDEQLWTLMVWALGTTLAWRGVRAIREVVYT